MIPVVPRRDFLLTAALATAAVAAPAAAWPAQAIHTFAAGTDAFLLDGQPFVIRSGEMHYPRVPRPYWRDRFRKMRALGLNTVCTYVFWNLHEPRPGVFDFRDNLDLATYLKTAHEEGLWAILRPGPYICTEWDFGGLPAWLLADPSLIVRGSDPKFLAASARYLRRVGAVVAPLQITHGGPLLMAQVENEYGSFGSDHAYMAAIRDQMRAAGFDITLYTSDGPSPKLLGNGTLPELPCVINFGDGDAPARQFAQLAQFRPTGPRMCGEYWAGWFDHWGESHHTTPAAKCAAGVAWMLQNRVSFNLYMFHGGTSFGFMSGANFSRVYQPDVSSYDYDAPLSEDGRPSAKFAALQAVILPHLEPGGVLPPLPPSLPGIAIPRFELRETAPLSQLLSAPQTSPQPLAMESLPQAYGLVWYRTPVSTALSGTLDLGEVRDYARVYQAGRLLGSLDRRLQQNTLAVTLDAGPPLDIVVENMGRINFGPELVHDRKGIIGKVTLAGSELNDWSMYSLPLDRLDQLRFTPTPATGPAFYRAGIKIDAPGDTFFDLSAWSKGFVWVNGHHLGRFWNAGPQRRIFVPGCWLRRGANEVVVFDYDPRPAAALSGMAP